MDELPCIRHRSRTIDIMQFFIEHSANSAAQDKDGSTALHQASRQGHVDLAQFLVEHGADVTAQDKYRSTPLRQVSRTSREIVYLAQFLARENIRIMTDGFSLVSSNQENISREMGALIHDAQLHRPFFIYFLNTLSRSRTWMEVRQMGYTSAFVPWITLATTHTRILTHMGSLVTMSCTKSW